MNSSDMELDSCKTDTTKCKKDLKRHFLMTCIFCVVSLTMDAIGGFLFFYIEHCYASPPQQMDSLTQKYFDLCGLVSEIHEHSNATKYTERGNVSSFLSTKTAIAKCEQTFKTREMMVPKCELDFLAFWKWVQYSSAIGYTIGYGNIVTRSSLGRMVTIVYAIPAIAAKMTFNIYVGNTFIDITTILILLFYSKILKRSVVSRLPLKVFFFQIISLFNVCVIYAGMCQAVLFRRNGITFTDAIYFSFVTFSSIGFGDILISGDLILDISAFDLIVGSVTFFVGMGIVASTLTSLSELLTIHKKKKNSRVLKMLEKKHQSTVASK